MFVILLDPITVAVLLALLVEIVVAPLFDFAAQKLGALCNRNVLVRRGKGTLAVDRSLVVPTAGIFLSRRPLYISSSLKKILIFGVFLGEIFLDTEPEDQLKPVSGIVLKRLDTFRDIITWEGISEELVRELPYARRACRKGDTFFETAFVGNDTICGEIELFSISFEGPGVEQYDTDKPCALGDLADERMLCEGNRITFPCTAESFESPLADSSCTKHRMFELLNETALRYAGIDSEGNVYGDIVNVNFRSPVTTELIGNITLTEFGFEMPVDFTLLTASIKDDPLQDFGGDPPIRTANVFASVAFHTRVTRTALICFCVVLALFASFLLLVAFAHIANRQPSETKAVNPVNTLESIVLSAVHYDDVKKKPKFQVLLSHTEDGPRVKLAALSAVENARSDESLA
ncbi:hypothetical protein FGB62_22g817 [Gracilaria domingensis]|nr:hypothetical protein FGB62_22g817 [Gracilaria domingensis]